MIMDKKKTVKQKDEVSVEKVSLPTEKNTASTAVGRLSRPKDFRSSSLGEAERTDSVNKLASGAEATVSTKVPVSLPTGPIISINDSLNALALGRTMSMDGQGQGDAAAAGPPPQPPLSPDSFISSTCSVDIDSPTTSGPDPESESDIIHSLGGSGASSPTSSATSSGMSIGPEYAHSYPQPSVRPKDHRNATWPEGLTSSSVGAGSKQRSTGSVGSLPFDGTVTRDGEMVSYVADDLLEKIRRSASPRVRGASSPSTTSQSSSRSSFASSAIPPIDPTALADLEKHSKRVADSLDLMMGHLNSTLHNMSAISVGHIQTYRDAVDKAGLTVDQSVKAMYALIAKCEELSRTMVPVEDLAKQIKSIKKQLDEFEAVCK
ncbi:uncharacterized protein [Amphiura filiformis]|uniref:uncharacterized protein n=1 Tax=Amphiura filiformis TaxID=82378 RepID=UPI003B21614B